VNGFLGRASFLETFRAPLALGVEEDGLELDQETRMSLEPKRVEQLFADTLGQADPDAQARLLDQQCGADAALRRRIEELLTAHLAAGSFLEPADPPAPGSRLTDELDSVARPLGALDSTEQSVDRDGTGPACCAGSLLSSSGSSSERRSRVLPEIPGYVTASLPSTPWGRSSMRC
jgi:hypothetical protein